MPVVISVAPINKIRKLPKEFGSKSKKVLAIEKRMIYPPILHITKKAFIIQLSRTSPNEQETLEEGCIFENEFLEDISLGITVVFFEKFVKKRNTKPPVIPEPKTIPYRTYFREGAFKHCIDKKLVINIGLALFTKESKYCPSCTLICFSFTRSAHAFAPIG